MLTIAGGIILACVGLGVITFVLLAVGHVLGAIGQEISDRKWRKSANLKP